jgi:hypothetical protein
MKKKQILIVGALILTFLAGIFLTRSFYKEDIKTENSVEKVQVLLEKIEQVSKLISVEGHFSEVYDYKEYKSYDIAMFRKKALVRVKAKVAAGYDLGQMKVSSDELTKTIKISNIPDIEILAIDHDLDYYDITEGSFNKFSEADLNKINERAKEFIRKTALESEIVQDAEIRGNKVFELIRYMVENAGWTLEIEQFEDAVPVKE